MESFRKDQGHERLVHQDGQGVAWGERVSVPTRVRLPCASAIECARARLETAWFLLLPFFNGLGPLLRVQREPSSKLGSLRRSALTSARDCN